jgi:hypothetical protein
LLREGFQVPLIVWRSHNLLLDGYNRRLTCVKHGITFWATAVDLPDLAVAIAWIIENQLGRRNANVRPRVTCAGCVTWNANVLMVGRARRREQALKRRT